MCCSVVCLFYFTLTYIYFIRCSRKKGVSVSAAVSWRRGGKGLYLLEVEDDSNVSAKRNELATLLTEIGSMLQERQVVEDENFDPDATEDICVWTAKQAGDAVMRMSGEYDRGMVYRFQDDLSGEILHEIKNDDKLKSSYLGMRFPAGDMPLSCRQLQIINGLRYVSDANVPSSKIVCAKDVAVDLTHCRMRGVAAPHVDYLRNMGVRSSMVVSILASRKLWGMLSFHGYSHAFKPDLHLRIAFETVAQMVSIRIASLFKR